MGRFEGKPIDMGVLAGDEVRSEINSMIRIRKSQLSNKRKEIELNI